MRLVTGSMVVLVALTGCKDVIDLDPVDERAAVEAVIRPKPIEGGTLVVTSDGVAVAADPDRDLVHLVDVAERSVRHTVALEPGDEPGRVVQGSGALAHVVLRGFGGIATLDYDEGKVVSRRWLCPDPRGIAFEAEGSTRIPEEGGQPKLHVACADGTLVSMDEAPGGEVVRTRLEPDLRDVMVVDGAVLVSQFRTASILRDDGTRLNAPSNEDFAASVAWRTWAAADGGVAMLHQFASKRPVPIEPAPEDELPYGGGGDFCAPGIVEVALTTFRDGQRWTTPLPGAPLTVDAAMSPDGAWFALAMPGAPEGTASAGVIGVGDSACFVDMRYGSDEQVTAVAFASDGTLVMQSREPARLLIGDDAPFGSVTAVELEGESRYDSGHEIFHRATDSGLSCASCHPGGADDGHVWVFDGLGKRRTQPLDVGLEGTAPFHWDGDMTDLDVLVEEVLAHRMGGNRQSRARGESFARWLFAQQRPPADAGMDDPVLVAEGEALFESYDCGRCHAGETLGGTMTTPIRGRELQVPVLRRVSLHPPYMHDGRSLTLDDSVRDMLETTTAVAEPATHDVQALSAYLRTL